MAQVIIFFSYLVIKNAFVVIWPFGFLLWNKNSLTAPVVFSSLPSCLVSYVEFLSFELKFDYSWRLNWRLIICVLTYYMQFQFYFTGSWLWFHFLVFSSLGYFYIVSFFFLHAKRKNSLNNLTVLILQGSNGWLELTSTERSNFVVCSPKLLSHTWDCVVLTGSMFSAAFCLLKAQVYTTKHLLVCSQTMYICLLIMALSIFNFMLSILEYDLQLGHVCGRGFRVLSHELLSTCKDCIVFSLFDM